ncbi:MAG: ABC transporter permease [Nevskiales bacterium]
MFAALFGQAWHAIGANRLRTLLTMLGMVIGVGAVILMLAIGQGASRMVTGSIEAIGSNLLIVMSGGGRSSGARTAVGNLPTLTVDDAAAIAKQPGVAAMAPISTGSAQVVYGSANWNTLVYGTTPAYLTVREWSLLDGVAFTDSDVRSVTRVALIGQTVVDNLFGGQNPVGRTLRIQKSPFLVIGVLASKGQSLDGRDQDDTVIIPLTTAQRQLFGEEFVGSLRMVIVQADSADAMPVLEREIAQLLRKRHRLAQEAEDDFAVRNLTALAATALETTKIMTWLLGAIASVSLLVGGIGIMNIMLVSVTERTAEIGVRMAVGARRRDILAQFLIEALLVAVAGCLIGLVLGIGCAALAEHASGMDTVVTGGALLLSFSVAAVVGVVFGFYPAWRAAQLNPIEALRYG